MKSTNGQGEFLFGGFVIGAFVGGIIMWIVASEYWRFEAVNAGAAKHVMVDEHGHTEFQWIAKEPDDE